MEYTPKEELDKRVVRLQEYLLEKGLSASFIIQKADLFYFSGTTQSSVLFVPAQGSPVLFTRKSYKRACKESSLDNIMPLNSNRELPDLLRDQEITHIDRIGMEFDSIPTTVSGFYQRIFPSTAFSDISKAVRDVRTVKSHYEIELMREAGRISDDILREAKSELKPGRTEVEIASHLLTIAYMAGSEGPAMIRDWNRGAFTLPMVLSGESGAIASFTDGPLGGAGISSLVSFGPSGKRIKEHEPIVIDIGATYNGYQVDVTRTFSVGEMSSSLMDAYEATLKIQERLIKELVPGKKCSGIYRIAEEMAMDLGYVENFMGYGENRVRFVGHGIGIEMNEFPVFAGGFDTLLEEGMTVAIEPKFIFPGLGAVGVENTWLIKSDRPEPLTMADEALGIV